MDAGRWTAEQLDGDEQVTVFLIGMRVNRWWKPWAALRMGAAMAGMQRHLATHPEAGLLASHQWFGRTTMMLSYWRSPEHLQRFASDPELTHLPAWRRYAKLVQSSGDVGVWHETYRVAPGAHEVVYVNMPAFGLGRAVGRRPIGPGLQTAKQRLRATPGPARTTRS